MSDIGIGSGLRGADMGLCCASQSGRKCPVLCLRWDHRGLQRTSAILVRVVCRDLGDCIKTLESLDEVEREKEKRKTGVS